MVDVAVLPAFAALMMVLLIAPGPNMVFMVAVGLESGPEGAAKAILGIATGLSAYTVGVVAGMGRIAESHPPLFEMVKLLGAGYLVWLAIRTTHSAQGFNWRC